MEYGGYATSASEVDSTYVIFKELERILRRRRYASMTYGWGTGHTPADRTLAIDFGGTELLDELFSTVDRRDDDWYGNGRFPASEAEIARLPVATTGEMRETDCGVCLERFEEGEVLRKMTCPSSHGFHETCILKWLRVSRLCPLCRFALPAQHEDEPEVEETNAAAMIESVAGTAEDTGMEGDTDEQP